MGEVDTAFIQEPLNRAKLCVIEAEEIPVIDLSPITNKAVADSSSIEGLVKEIGFACKEWGFFQVINHGVPQSLRENIEKASRMFFGQSVRRRGRLAEMRGMRWVIMTLSTPRTLGTGKKCLILWPKTPLWFLSLLMKTMIDSLTGLIHLLSTLHTSGDSSSLCNHY